MGSKRKKPANSNTESFADQVDRKLQATVASYVNQMGNNLARQQASTLETLFSRLVVLEKLSIEKLGVTSDDLTNRVADLEDAKVGLEAAEEVKPGDTIRITIKTKAKSDDGWQGESKLKVADIGLGETLGSEIEAGIIGMKTGEVKEISFGKDGEMSAQITLARISREKPPVETGNA